MSRYRRQVDNEPLTIDGDVIARYLEERGQHAMAAHVRRLDARVTSDNREAMRWQTAYRELEAKLPKTTRHKPFDPTPPPEASD